MKLWQPPRLRPKSSRYRTARRQRTKRGPSGTESEPFHVLSRTAVTGWAAIERVLDDFDKEEIEGVKSDIDTLLVFIGLFSAVLTAFVAVSFGLLQDDSVTTKETLQAIKQLSVQMSSFTLQGGFLNSTTPAQSTDAPAFQPTTNAIRVNVLWSASLIISISTASFGILVKQWLREYMRFVTSFPQGRLRVRKFRRSGLDSWHVLAVAAFLPLLLQTALGFFFLGLCFFTADVHSSVRNTTVPLVAGWAFIFLFVTISPLFSAHCPYKTPALDSLMAIIRAEARNLWISLWKGLCRLALSIVDPLDFGLMSRVGAAVFYWADTYYWYLTHPERPYEETAATKDEVGDLDIMADADELQGNDELFGTAMVEVLQQSKPDSQEVVPFILRILKHRVQWDGEFPGQPRSINCQALTPRAADAVRSFLNYIPPHDVLHFLDDSEAEKRDFARWTVFLLLSVSAHPTTVPPPRVLQKLFSERRHSLVDLCVSVPTAPGLQTLLHMICLHCQESNENFARSLVQIRDGVLDAYFRRLELPEVVDAGTRADDKPWNEVLNRQSLEETVTFLTELLCDEVAPPADKWSDSQLDGLSFLVQLIAVGSDFSDEDFSVQIIPLSRIVFSSTDALRALLLVLTRLRPYQLHTYLECSEFGTDVGSLTRLASSIEAISSPPPNNLTRLSVLALCDSVAERLCDVREHINSPSLTQGWRSIFAALTRLLKTLSPPNSGSDRAQATWVDACYRWLPMIDTGSQDRIPFDAERYAEWVATFDPGDSPVPDGFHVALMRIYVPVRPSWRVRRLQGMSDEAREAAERDVEPFVHSGTGDKSEGAGARDVNATDLTKESDGAHESLIDVLGSVPYASEAGTNVGELREGLGAESTRDTEGGAAVDVVTGRQENIGLDGGGHGTTRDGPVD